MHMEMVEVAAALLVVLGVGLILGVWVGLALILSGLAAMMFVANVPVGAVFATTVWSANASWTLAALPLFIWMGEILFRTRLSEELFRGLSPWVGRLPGRLVHVNVVGCGIFGMVSGSSAATCATIGKIALPELTKRGYDERISIGALAGSGTLGLLIPPSIIMIVYAVQAEVSLVQMFLAGFLPGALVMLLYSGYIAAWSLLNPDKQPPPEPRVSFRQALKESANLIPTLLLILFVFAALLSGTATATECAAWGVLGSLLRFVSGVSIFKLVRYLAREYLLIVSTSSSESALPRLIAKMEHLGVDRSTVGVVVPTGYSFTLDGTSIYLSMAAIFIAQAFNVDLTIWQQLTILGLLMLTSKGAAAVTGGGFVTLAATLSATGVLPIEGLALLLGVDRFMSEARALTNLVGNGVATVVVAKMEGEFDESKAVAEYQQHFKEPALARI